MKKVTVLISLILMVVLATFSYGEVWTVDSNPGNNAADFTTAQAAHDGAAAGDTLYFSGSTVDYGELSLSKQLYIFGPGYFLNENDSTQANQTNAVLRVMEFHDGSEGSMISGCRIYACDIYVNNITIKRNYIYRRTGNSWAIHIRDNADYINITQNYITPTNNGIGFAGNNNNISLTNNYISFFNTTCIQSQTSCSNIIVENNIIVGRIYLYNSTIANNIFRPNQYSTYTGNSSNIITNNICSAEQFDTTGNNQQNIDMATVFVGEGSTDGQWQIIEGGPADGNGTFGTDIGMFGGNKSYILSGIPKLPAIYYFLSPSAGSGTLPVQVKIKSRH